MSKRKNGNHLSTMGSLPVAHRSPTRTFINTPVRPRPVILRVRAKPVLALQTIEDRRMYHPETYTRPVMTFSRRDQRRIVHKAQHISNNLPKNGLRSPLVASGWSKVGFAVPKKVALCVRRKVRREAILALGLGGAGARQKRRKRNYWSTVSC